MTETVNTYRRRSSDKQRTFDWRFWAALAAMALVVYIVWSGFNASHQRDVVLSHYSSLVASDQAKDKAQAEKDLQASAERAAILHQLDLLSDRYDTLNTNYDNLASDYVQLLSILKAHGITVPKNLVTVVVAPKQSSSVSPRVSAPGQSSQSKSTGKGHHKKK